MKGWFHSNITDLAKSLVAEALSNNQLTTGPHTKQLETEISSILNVPFCVYTNSGTSALSIALLTAGANNNSSVAIPGIGWIATPQAAQLTGAQVSIVDVTEKLPLLDLDIIRSDYDFIIPVNYNGRQVDINKLREKCPNSVIIEDSCKSLFSRDFTGSSLSGSNGDYGCFSLGMITSLPGVYGGLITAREAQAKYKIETIKYHGTSYIGGQESYDFPSYNFKSSNLHAAFALGMLDSLQSRIKNLCQVYSMYCEGLKGLENTSVLPVDIENGQVPLLIDLLSSDRESQTSYLNSKGIVTCNYHKSLTDSPNIIDNKSLPNSLFFSSTVFHPPCGPDQDLSVVERTIDLLKQLG